MRATLNLPKQGSVVTTTRSIFQKVCPGCMMTLPTDARQCTCGFDFDQGNASEPPSSGEIRLDAEELYATYLAARARQADAAVKDAQRDFARDPANKRKSAQVAQALEEANAAKQALAAQSAHIAQLKKSQPQVTPPTVSIQAVSAALPVTPVSPKKIKNPPAIVAKKQAPASAPSVQAQVKKKTITAPAPVSTKRAVNVAAAAVAVKKNQTISARKKLVALAPPAARPAPAAVPVAVPVPAQAVQTVQPNEAFRQAQAAKAEKIVRESAKPAASVTAPVPAEKEITAKLAVNETKLTTPPAAAKTAPRLYTPADKKECPNCTSNVAMNVARCRCGYEFPTSELLPALSMSEEERSEFAKLFSNR